MSVPRMSKESDQSEGDNEAEQERIEGEMDSRGGLARSERRDGHGDHVDGGPSGMQCTGMQTSEQIYAMCLDETLVIFFDRLQMFVFQSFEKSCSTNQSYMTSFPPLTITGLTVLIGPLSDCPKRKQFLPT